MVTQFSQSIDNRAHKAFDKVKFDIEELRKRFQSFESEFKANNSGHNINVMNYNKAFREYSNDLIKLKKYYEIVLKNLEVLAKKQNEHSSNFLRHSTDIAEIKQKLRIIEEIANSNKANYVALREDLDKQVSESFGRYHSELVKTNEEYVKVSHENFRLRSEVSRNREDIDSLKEELRAYRENNDKLIEELLKRDSVRTVKIERVVEKEQPRKEQKEYKEEVREEIVERRVSSMVEEDRPKKSFTKWLLGTQDDVDSIEEVEER